MSTSEARAWTGVPQQPLPSATLEETVEWVAMELERHNTSRSWPPETQPTRFPYTNNRVDDFIGLAESRAQHVISFTQTPEYKRKVGFHLITGGSGAGKTRAGMEIRRMVAKKAVDCEENSFWATAQAIRIDFNTSGDPLSSADDHISAECMLGLRLAARNIFHCDLSDLRQHLPVQHQHLFSLRDVMKHLASQKRTSLGLGSDAIVLQVITVDELQLVFGQSVEVLQNNSRGLVNVLIRCLAAWMISGGAERCVCLPVLIGTGLEYAKLGLSGYEQTSTQIYRLTLSQVSDLMADSIAKGNRLTLRQANNILTNRVMRLQLNLLMGLPGFMDMALDVLHTNLETSVPQNDEDFRYTLISADMTLEDASTCSGNVWTLQHEDGVQVVLQPVVQYQAVTYCLSQMQMPKWTKLLRAMQECMPFPYNNIIDGPPYERLVATSIACRAHLFFAGVTNVPGQRTWSRFFPTAAMSASLGSCQFTVNALQLARDHRQLFRSTQGGGGSFDLTVDTETCLETAGIPDPHLTWDDPEFLVFMDSISGPPGPSGDLRFVVKTLSGKLQVVVVQCNKVGNGLEQGRDCTIHDIQHHLTQLRACFDRWNAKGTSVPMDLVYVWATTARASPKLLEFACQQQDLIVVHCDVIMRMCPLLAMAPELYSARPLAPLNPRLQARANRSSKQTYCALPKAHVRADWHSVPGMQVKKRHILHKISSLAYNAGCTQQYFVQRYV
ncbi:hypothetical protein ABBQ38_015218 [Trebouxia sp. C0009 RCD-2024]